MATFSGPDGSTGYLHATSTRSLQQQSHASTQHLGSSTFNGTSIAPQNVSYTPRTSVRPQFRSKVVCELACRHCQVIVCKRGMKAILLADTNVELYSTDSPPSGVALVNDDYITRNCHCRIRDVACLGCGNVVGYHVTQPCETCLEACNNGHFWMFHVEQVSSSDRLDSSGTRSLLWAHLPRADRDFDMRDRYELMCR
ncbi:FAM72 protein-domain-containing protein [Cladochytrium replicatum]|nr:FAM72 protein-domain-containing protein [Cladochytrium replicatum]